VIISDKTIKTLNAQGLLVTTRLNDIQLQPNSIDLTLGNTWKKLKPNSEYPNETVGGSWEPCISLDTPMMFEDGIFDEYVLKPGEFVLMASKEVLNIPNGLVGIVCGRSSLARVAIATEQAGFIDSGFTGTITLEVKNDGEYPVILKPGRRVAQVYFLRSEYSDRLYGIEKGSKYNNQYKAQESRIHLDPEFNQ
jgi:dCTP deaminase